MEDQERSHGRVSNCLDFEFSYEIIPGRDKVKSAKLLDISAGGFKAVTKGFVKAQTPVNITLVLPEGTIRPVANILSSANEWYTGDEGKDLFCTLRVKFTKITLEEKKHIIKYVYQCMKERREAGLSD